MAGDFEAISTLLFHSMLFFLFLTSSPSPIPSGPDLSHPIYLILLHLMPMHLISSDNLSHRSYHSGHHYHRHHHYCSPHD